MMHIECILNVDEARTTPFLCDIMRKQRLQMLLSRKYCLDTTQIALVQASKVALAILLLGVRNKALSCPTAYAY